MNTVRPNPDELLERLRSDEMRERRGKLKIFFGYAAGVGKTFAMLEAARREMANGVDVVVGYVEPHGRAETEALLQGLESIPLQRIEYRGVELREFDLNGALQRRPRLILVDELAHTNAPGSRHAKRWQDVEELLEAGIDVWSTLNVQHIESLNDVVAQVSGVIVSETLPDSVLERADEFELVDLTPDELIDRLRKGKVYVPQQAERALAGFFLKGNLSALRELALRQAATRLQRDVDDARRERSAEVPWATTDRLLVCVGPSPSSAKLIRRAKRMAAAGGSEWIAVAVDIGAPGTDAIRHATAEHLRLAAELGAETQVLIGDDVAAAVVQFARERNVSRIVVGKTAQPLWHRWWRRSVVDRLLEQSGEIDVYVVRGDVSGSDDRRTIQQHRDTAQISSNIDSASLLGAAAVVALSWGIGRLMFAAGLAEANIVMVFLLGVAFVAARWGRLSSILAAVASVLVFDFFFVHPYFSFTVTDTQYLFTFAVMLTIGLVISGLTVRVQQQLRTAQAIQRGTDALYRLTRRLSQISGAEFLIQTAGRELGEIFSAEIVIYVREGDGGLNPRFGGESILAKTDANAAVARWVAENDRPAGVGTDTLPSAAGLFVPLTGSRSNVGALGVRFPDQQRFVDPDQLQLLETCASLIALSLERDQSTLEAHRAQLQVQTEQLRNSLLSSVSHDLRTPLAAIAGSASSLLQNPPAASVQHELLESIVDEAQRLTRLIDNLLDMTRIEAGAIALNRQWHVLEELIGSARRHLQRELADRTVRVDLPAKLPLLHVDGTLMEQVLTNLLENAARYTPAGSRIEIAAKVEGSRVQVRVADNGPGFEPGTETRIFEKFFRGTSGTPDARRGVGLGLSICRGIIEAHGGTIVARNRAGGGAEFVISLPLADEPPHVPAEELT